MSDYQALVQHIRGFLASNFQMKTDEVAGWAEQFARLSRETNERLRQCGDYLNKRLRVEAIHAAEAAPNLLDMVAALDLPELQEWKDICFRYEMPDPPTLLLDIASLLNEAYAQEQPLEGLMAYHRLMALARAPLRNRLTVMRKLEAMDTTSAVLEEDIRTFERLRLEEIRDIVPTLAKVGEVDAVHRLQDELSERWHIQVPADLRRLVDDLARKFQRSAAEAELRQLMPALTAAYSAMSFEEASALLQQFLATASQWQIAVPADLQTQIDPIHNWLYQQQGRLQQEAQFMEACAAFRQTLDADAPTPQIDHAYRAALAFNIDLDPNLQARYRNVLAARAAAARNKKRLIFGGIAAAVLLVIIAAVVIIYVILRSHEVRDALATIQQQTADVELGDVARVRATVKQVLDQHPRVSSDSDVARALADFKRASDSEEQRQARFKANIAVVRASRLPRRDDPALKAAEADAKLPDEHKAVADLSTTIEQNAQTNQDKLVDEFSREADDLDREIAKALTPELLASHPASYASQVTRFDDRIRQLDDRTGVPAITRQLKVEHLRATLAPRRARLDDIKVELTLLDEIKKAATVDEQERAIKAYLEKSADAADAVEFRNAARLVPMEKAVEAWGQLTRGWGGQLLPATYAAAAARVVEAQKYVTENNASPLAKPVAAYVAYLKIGLDAAGPDGAWKGKYRELLQNALVRDLAMVETTDGKRYYLLPEAKVRQHGGALPSVDFDAVLTLDVSRTDKIKVIPPVGLKSPAPLPSPQADYAKATLAQLDALDFAGWDTFGTRAMRDVLANKQMDPFMKATLLRKALEVNQPLMTWAGDTGCKALFDELAAQKVEAVEWLNPDKPPSPELAAALAQTMARVPLTERLDEAVRRRRDAAMADLPLDLGVSGILLREESRLQLHMRGASPEGAVAYAVSSTGNLVPLARRGATEWVVDAAQEVPAGSLVFVSGAGK